MSQTCINTGKITSSRIITKSAGMITSVLVRTDGSNDATVTLYDGTSTAVAASKVRYDCLVAGGAGTGGRNWSQDAYAPFDDGLFCALSGSSAFVIIEYKQ